MTNQAAEKPVIVLTAARSGSTLLRLLLDAHPELACPAETNIAKTCLQLASAWTVTGGSASEDELSEPARASLRAAVDSLFGEYLSRRGKSRWCDKSIGTAAVAEWFTKLYPEARFVCLYRHCMDVIYSGLEASPWGLTGYGFEEFAGFPGGNNVSALAAYWIEHTGHILEFEQNHKDRCFRVYYEELVESPEHVAKGIFSFLGLAHIPGVTQRCFGADDAPAGPGDHKIRATRKITADSVGRGVRIPVGMIPPPQLGVVNHLLGQLGYTQVDGAWQRSARPPALLNGKHSQPGEQAAGPKPAGFGEMIADSVLESIGKVISGRVNTAFSRSARSIDADELADGRTFELVAYHPDKHWAVRRWRIDLGERSIASVDTSDTDRPGPDWLLTGDVETWLRVLAERANMASCLRSGEMRYIGMRDEDGQDGEAAGTELFLVAKIEKRLSVARELLGLAGYPEEVSG